MIWVLGERRAACHDAKGKWDERPLLGGLWFGLRPPPAAPIMTRSLPNRGFFFFRSDHVADNGEHGG
jgi:hypothetical protein